MNDIEWVERDIGKNVICLKARYRGEESIYYRAGENIKRIGKWIPDIEKRFRQVRTIFFQKQKFAGSSGEEWIKRKDKKIDKPELMRAISKRDLAKIDLDRLSTLKKNGVRYLPKGWLRINYWIKKNGVLISSPRHAADIEAAIRMQEHAMAGYKEGRGERPGEIKELIEFNEIIEEANRFLNEWKQSSEPDKKIIAEKLFYVVLKLEKCRNDFKVAAEEQIIKTLSFTDSLGRANPGAMAARTVAALNRLAGRFNELRIVMPIVALRHELLIFEKTWFKQQIKQISIMLRSILNRPRGNLFQNSADIDRHIGQSLYLIDILWASPYYERAQLSKIFLMSAKSALHEKTPEEMIKNIIFAHHVLNDGLPPKL